MTVVRRKEPRIYVTLWYLTAAYVWTVFNYAFGHFILPYSMPGVNNAAMHGLYIHYVVGLWITPAGLAVIYYFLPLSAQRPLYSHKLSLVGFWSLAFFYPFVGTHHYIYSPIPYWTQTIAIVASMMLIIPVWTVLQNFYGTFVGNWKRFQESYTAKFLIIGALYYLIGCFQGSTEALRGMQRLTHFTDFVIAHSHLTVFGTFILWVTAGMYYVIPRVSGHELYSKTLAQWHYWLTVAGLLADGGGPDASGPAAGDDARRWRGLRGLDGGDEALLVHADACRRHDGHRRAAGDVELLHDGRAWAAHRGAGLGAVATPEPQWT